MGCDIHPHVEVKIKGKWEHYSTLCVSRNYLLFAKMAGVRNYDIEAISPPRGLPEDVSVVTKFESDDYGVDGHTHSWLSATEAGEIQRWYEKHNPKPVHHPPLFGYLFGNHIDSYVRFPEDGKRIRELGYEDARVVFWFDN